MAKGFPKDHPGFASRRKKMVTRQLSTAVRERISASIYVEYHLAILAGHDPKIIDPVSEPPDQHGRDGYARPGQPASECGLRVVWEDRGGIPPTLEQRTASLKFLSDRGYGQAPQMITLEAELRGQIAESRGEIPISTLRPEVLSNIRALLGGSLVPKEIPGPTFPDIMDADCSETPLEVGGEAHSTPPHSTPLHSTPPHSTPPHSTDE